MLNAICLWVGRIFLGAATLLLTGFFFACLLERVRQKYPCPEPLQKENAAIVENWLTKKNFSSFKKVYFELFILPKVWWWRPGFRIWRIIRNTWINGKYKEYLKYLKAHEK